MYADLSGTRVAILATEGVEQVELTSPQDALRKAGATTVLISLERAAFRAWNHFEKGDTLTPDMSINEAHASEFDALLLPGGLANPDQLRMDPRAVALVRSFFQQRKPVAAICHAPWLLAQADVLRGRTVTSYPSIRVDLINAGADWVDAEVVVDNGLVTSRSPADLRAFNERVLEEVREKLHDRQRASAAGQAGGASPA